uniref:Uncharacterized protein n=1 Tax=Anopheles atroparvus TaxID=41427 RepID=A0A182IUZ9_ANOAO
MLIELSKFSDKLRQYRLILEKLTAEQQDYQRRRERLSGMQSAVHLGGVSMKLRCTRICGFCVHLSIYAPLTLLFGGAYRRGRRFMSFCSSRDFRCTLDILWRDGE